MTAVTIDFDSFDFDLADEADRLVLADLLEDHGRDAEAALCRAGRVDATKDGTLAAWIDEPRRHDTVVRTTGYHESGHAYEERVDVATTYQGDDPHGTPWEDLTYEGRQWWADWVERMHALRVREASLTGRAREIYNELIYIGRLDGRCNDYDTLLVVITGLIDEAEAEARAEAGE